MKAAILIADLTTGSTTNLPPVLMETACREYLTWDGAQPVFGSSVAPASRSWYGVVVLSRVEATSVRTSVNIERTDRQRHS
jgi:hypothetical protein